MADTENIKIKKWHLYLAIAIILIVISVFFVVSKGNKQTSTDYSVRSQNILPQSKSPSSSSGDVVCDCGCGILAKDCGCPSAKAML